MNSLYRCNEDACVCRSIDEYDIMGRMNEKINQAGRFRVIIPADVKPHPDRYEEEVARLLATRFRSDIAFVARGIGHTPDVQVLKTKQFWEIKNIRGNSKKTIEDNLRKAAKQSDFVVISLLRTQMSPMQAKARIEYYLAHARANIKHVILITKKGKCLDFHA